MSTEQPVAIVTGASSGIGLGVTQALLARDWRVAATSRTVSKSKDLKPSPELVLGDGEVSKKETAVKVVEAAIQHFGRIDLLVNGAGIFIPKAFTDYTEEDYNLSGDDYQRRQLFLHVAAGDSADEEAKFGACGEHLGGSGGSTERRRARTFGGAVEVADAGSE